ncbi:MAG: HD domain-containing protein [Clostridia bacterium]|nr:HD domain-containing protein [Clostridia bacterium]
MIQMNLPNPVMHALQRLNEAGFEAYVVGGCVRDSLLGKEPEDWDITTNALPTQTKAVFADQRTIETGISHGTVTVLYDGMPLEITTYRIDGEYTDGRRPDSITFSTSLREDLRRRDFTINALAYHPKEGVIDHFSGLADLDAGHICCVGDPHLRFTEDALRIARALRFSAALGFKIEKVTATAIHKLAPLLRKVSVERISTELKKLLCGKDARRVLLEFSDVLTVMLPELQPMMGLQQENPYHHLSVYEHTVETVAAVPATPLLRLTMLFHDVGKPNCYTRDLQGFDHFRGHPPISAAIAEQTLERLHFDRQTIHHVKKLILHHDDTLSITDKALKQLLNRMGPELAPLLVEVQKADVWGQHPDKRDERLIFLDSLKARLSELIEQNACYSVKGLAITGEDLLKIGYSAGPKVGNALQSLLDAVIDGSCPNEPNSLLKLAKEML